MILDLNRFIKEEQPVWTELGVFLDRLDNDPDLKLDISQIKRLHYLYQRSSSDLSRLAGFSAQKDVKVYLESLVGRAFSKIHENRRPKKRFNVIHWALHIFPATFRRHLTLFWIALAVMTAGAVFGAGAIGLDKDSKPALMPFSHLLQDPSERVAKEENIQKDQLAGHKSTFASYLISNNTRVSFFAFSLGITWGIGTVLILFSNGIFLGATIADYILAGQTKFLLAWLLPHGSVELPAIILAGQAGLVLANAVIGWGRPVPLKSRLRLIAKDLLTLLAGVCLMLLWAGFVEAFLSQYHEPVLPYTLKITFGTLQFSLLVIFLSFAGRQSSAKSGSTEKPS